MPNLTKKQRKTLRKQGLITNNNVYNINQYKKNGLQLQQIKPKTLNQEYTFEAFEQGRHLLLHGVAGTGKTFISLYLALREIYNTDQYNKIYVIRSAVPTRDIGFLPGKENDKVEVYELPYRAICTEIFTRSDAYDILKHNKQIEFVSTSFVRGITLSDAIIIVDEMNNMNFHELDSIITRIGENCRIIFCGDFRQSDLKSKIEKMELHKFMNIINRLSNFAHIEFTKEDILRSELVKAYIIERERQGISV